MVATSPYHYIMESAAASAEQEKVIGELAQWLFLHFILRTRHFPPEFFSEAVCDSSDYDDFYPLLLASVIETTFWKNVTYTTIDEATARLETLGHPNPIVTMVSSCAMNYGAARKYLKSLLDGDGSTA